MSAHLFRRRLLLFLLAGALLAPPAFSGAAGVGSAGPVLLQPRADRPAGMCLRPAVDRGPGYRGIARWTARCGGSARAWSALGVPAEATLGASGAGPPCRAVPSLQDVFADICEAWVATYDADAHDPPGYGSDVPVDFAVGEATDGDRIIVTGLSWGGAGADYDWATVAFDDSGRRLWVARRGTAVTGLFTGMDFPMAVTMSPDGLTAFVTGIQDFHLDPEYRATMATVAYDTASGAERWVALFDGPPEADFLDIGTAIAMSPDGTRLFVTGQTQTGPTPPTEVGFGQYPSRFVTVAYDASTGEPEWTSLFGEEGEAWRPVAIRPDPGGRAVYVVGERLPGREIATVAYDTGSVDAEQAGAAIWVARYDSDEIQYAEGLAAGDAAVFVSGTTIAGGSDARLLAIAYDTSGREIWRARNPDAGAATALGSRLAISPDGRRLFLSGTLNPFVGGLASGPPDYAVAAYDTATGTAVWSSRFDGAADTGISIDIAHAIGVSPDGREVHVTGQSGILSSWTYFGFDLQPPFVRLPWGGAATTVVLDAESGARTRVARFSPAVAEEGGAFGYGLAFGRVPGRAYTLAGIATLGAVDNWIDFACGSVISTCLPADRNMDDYAVIAYEP